MNNEERKIIDDCFYVQKGRFLWHSFLKDDTPLISSLTEEICISTTSSYLKQRQDGFPEQNTTYQGIVDGKL